MTRALKNAVMQQQVFSVDKALQILDQETPLLVVDKDKLKVCLFNEKRVFSKSWQDFTGLFGFVFFCILTLHILYSCAFLSTYGMSVEIGSKCSKNTDIF